VTKRDIFHIFHKYGTVAQIAIKQAYGFVQFETADACFAALDHEQGSVIREKKMRKSERPYVKTSLISIQTWKSQSRRRTPATLNREPRHRQELALLIMEEEICLTEDVQDRAEHTIVMTHAPIQFERTNTVDL